MAGIGIVVNVVGHGVRAVVKEDASTCNAVLGPMMDTAFVVRSWAGDIGAAGVIVELAGFGVGELVSMVSYLLVEMKKLSYIHV